LDQLLRLRANQNAIYGISDLKIISVTWFFPRMVTDAFEGSAD
jgi:hypothetical protein